MGYVKLKKATGDFDILSDAGVATVKLVGGSTDTGKIEILFVGSKDLKYTIIPANWAQATATTHFAQGDVTKINEALLNAKGIAGNPVPELSQVVGEVTYA